MKSSKGKCKERADDRENLYSDKNTGYDEHRRARFSNSGKCASEKWGGGMLKDGKNRGIKRHGAQRPIRRWTVGEI